MAGEVDAAEVIGAEMECPDCDGFGDCPECDGEGCGEGCEGACARCHGSGEVDRVAVLLAYGGPDGVVIRPDGSVGGLRQAFCICSEAEAGNPDHPKAHFRVVPPSVPSSREGE